jgi:hypothetical protein
MSRWAVWGGEGVGRWTSGLEVEVVGHRLIELGTRAGGEIEVEQDGTDEGGIGEEREDFISPPHAGHTRGGKHLVETDLGGAFTSGCWNR